MTGAGQGWGVIWWCIGLIPETQGIASLLDGYLLLLFIDLPDYHPLRFL
jgi:hypothetical protein